MRYFIILSVLFLAFGCGNEESASNEGTNETNEGEDIELKELKIQVAELEAESARKDSVMVETAKIFETIQNNLSQMAYTEGRIRRQSLNIESGEDPKEYILQEIEEINTLREANAVQIANLKSRMSDKNNQIAGLESLVEGLNNQIAVQEQEIEILKLQLDNLDQDYATMFDAYLDMADLAEDAMTKLNVAYFAYGSKKELKTNGVITKEGGFIGIGKTNVLKSDFNDTYFEKIDITQTKEIAIVGVKPEMITPHPSSSYDLKLGEESSVLVIKDPEKFWGSF